MQREKLDGLFQARAKYHGQIGPEQYLELQRTTKALEAELKKHIKDYPPADYTNEAKDCKIQGSVPVRIAIDGIGLVSDLRVIRFLGFGLDEQAVAAVRQWTFQPAMLQGGSVPVRANVEVNFRLREGRAGLGDVCAKYFSGVDLLEGNGVGKDEALAVPRIQAAAAMGLAEAQLRLAGLYEYGDAGVGLDSKRSGDLYRECANVGLMRCEAGLGRVLISDSLHRVEGMAWLELAAENGSAEAKELFAKELEYTPADQQAQARALKKILLPN